jgi:cystathionine beta-lyase
MSNHPNFDEVIDRVGTHSNKWDDMEQVYGVSPKDGVAMWVADMDFRPPQCVSDTVKALLDQDIYGYFGDYSDYKNAISWWMKNRHGWSVAPDWILTTHGLVNAVGVALQAYTDPGQGVILFTPVYHAFARVTKANDREVVECQLSVQDGRYVMDFDAYQKQLTGNERMIILCSPHNPGGRVWTRAELAELSAFCIKNDLIVISDEVHQDLVYPGNKHLVLAHEFPELADRLITLSATSKTFNLAGNYTGNAIIADPVLRGKYTGVMKSLSMSGNIFGLHMATAAYSPGGADWVDALVAYLDGNRQAFDRGVNAIPGLSSMKLDATFLSWVDFSGTGMEMAEILRRVQSVAKIGASHGPTFGKGGDTFLRFNIGTTRATIDKAVERLSDAFADLQ